MPARVLCLPLLVAAVAAQPLEIVNLHGGISVEIVPGSRVQIRRSEAEAGKEQGIAISRSSAGVLAEALPPAGRSPDIEARLPLGLPFAARTDGGDIRLRG
ncbi:MAG: hypothetical protein OXD30_04855, partial [Bryobacterales bacterium]|nr:hypothetical protein [Bryobacterales bacterium]